MKLVVLTGAGISAESGLKTFRDSDGLWEGYNVYDVATPEAWLRNPELVQAFYNERRKQVLAAEPNNAHHILKELENHFEVEIITQNIDDLHERAGSRNITHLHGIITKSQSSMNARKTYPIKGAELKMGELCPYGSQLRPHVVWFGEAVPMIETAAEICATADVFVLIGTSLAVYPAAGLMDFVPKQAKKYIIDPHTPDVKRYQNIVPIVQNAINGMAQLKEILLHDK
ncbi:SIR2 family NAD-dependent protein deacylase [Pedobacter sp. MW01-1-1]|uniref:SIR2 family NAD-dependent protein deacylase n=1 Tax=Pedobacter sp. MW01-1-1 TaxID=3383027 RepID=UPI003FF04D64